MRFTLCLLFLPMALCGQELAPWNSNRHPSDAPKRHVQEIAAGKQEYRVAQGGTMDGRNCRSPQGVWTPFEQTWESNRSVRMENVGQSDVVNPWLSNGSNDFRTIQAIVARAAQPDMSDREKAMALWWQQVQLRFHYEGDNRELASPVKVLNVYGHNTCGNDSICLAGLWKAAGLKVAPARLVGHCVTQVFYDGGWHLFDGDMHSLYLLRDNETIAGEQDLVRDHDLIKRTHTQGILRPAARAGDEWEASIYVFEGEVAGDRNADKTPAMNMTLRPGEALVWRWGHTEPAKCFGSARHKFAERVCNGLWEYRPNFSKAAWRKGADSAEGFVSVADGLAAEEGKTGEIIWTIRSPYVLVGGKLEVQGIGALLDLSWDGKTWEQAGPDLDPFFPPVGTGRYTYQLRCRLSGAARLRSLAIVNDLQMAPLSLPEMAVGENQFTYTDESQGERRVRITHEWVERSASAPPAAPAVPVRPTDGGEAAGTDVVFEWQPAADPDGEPIADYHFELSARADMKWPLSMSFARLISRTSDSGAPRFTVQAPGELNPDRQYYWHVRAKDARGVWGDWSKTWSFTPRGPAPPQNLALDYDAEKSVGILRWKPNSLGRRPAAYRVYASDEKGFSVSDETFRVAAGLYDFRAKTATESPTQFPGNFLAETKATQLTVIGPGLALAANKAFYRVVAVDDDGKRSGPSDYVAAPRPVIHSKPPAQTRTGEEFRYDVSAIRSLGDMRTRVVDGREKMNYWDVEQPRFEIVRGPAWLSIDPATGRLSGKPDRAGRAEVVVATKLEREQRSLDPAHLQWGIEKATQSRVETVGTARQSFMIEIAP
ncbi:MAG TPA: hypothetical protein VFB80_24475 [Pirellulaceae bacterium]|nr:hypothetical protein [Pirellulaceae bacterium]